MLCRILVAAVAISYLICVLLLSGIQKEDLDVSMLQKLQQYNVNVDDIDKKLYKDCVPETTENNVTDTRRSIDQNVTTIDKQNWTSKENPENLKGINYKNMASRDMSYLEEKALNNNSKINIDKQIHEETNTEDYNFQRNLHNKIKVKKEENIEINNNSITDNKNQSVLQNLIKFWNIYKNMNIRNITQNNTNNFTSSFISSDYDRSSVMQITQTTEMSINFKKLDNINSEDIQNINKLIADYISSKRIPNSNSREYLHNVKRRNNFNETASQKEEFLRKIKNESNTTITNNKHIIVLKERATTNINDNNFFPLSKYNRNQSAYKLNESYEKPEKYPKSPLLHIRTIPVPNIDNIPQTHHFYKQTKHNNNIYYHRNSKAPFQTNTDYKDKDTDILIYKDLGINIGDNTLPVYKQNDTPKEVFYVREQNDEKPLERKIIPVSEIKSNINPVKILYYDDKLNFGQYHRDVIHKQRNERKDSTKEEPIQSIYPNYNYDQDKGFNKKIETESKIQSGNNNTFNFDNEKVNDKLKSIPPEIIKEIAKNIKDMVLKDLKKEISYIKTTKATITTTPLTTIKTTTTMPIATTMKQPNPEKVQEATKVIEKFMELFEKFKSKNESTVSKLASKHKITKTNDVNEYNAPLHVLYSHQISAVNPYDVKRQQKLSAPINPIINPLQHQNSLVSNIHVIAPVNNTPIIQINGFHSAPITIQTNSLEIPPLGVPLSKPLQIFNQNIVVTTRFPETEHYRHKNDFKQNIETNRNKSDKERNSYLNTDLLKRLKNYDNKHHQKEDNSDETFKLRNRDHTKYNGNYDVLPKQDTRYYKPKLHDHSYHQPHPASHNIPKIHEALEKEKRQSEEECCDVHLNARQQIPINRQKPSNYDDTHFKNFLKTQQKVNEMLEKILATKFKSSIRDVEVI